MGKNAWKTVAVVLTTVGTIAWGIYGFTNLFTGAALNVVHALFGFSSFVEDVVYIAVAASGLYLAFAKK